MLYKVVLKFKSVDEILIIMIQMKSIEQPAFLWCMHAVGAVQGGSNVRVCG